VSARRSPDTGSADIQNPGFKRMRRIERMCDQKQKTLGVHRDGLEAADPKKQLPLHPFNPLNPFRPCVLDAY
jgi:hypothetical protein